MSRPAFDVGLAQLAFPGETLSGDRCVVHVADNRALIGVIDGVGHGCEAASAAQAAVDVLQASPDQPVGALLERCHERLRSTRGAAMTLLALDGNAGRIEWAGAGSVAAVLVQRRAVPPRHCRPLFVRGGVVGAQLASVETSSIELYRGDMLVVATDGVKRTFIDSISLRERPQKLAERLLEQHGTTHDDALIVVVRVEGSFG